MERILMMKGARKLVTMCAEVKPGEKVMVLTDMNLVKVAECVCAAAHEVGAEVSMSIMVPRKMHNEPLPECVRAAMKHVNVLFVPTTFSIAHTVARREATEAGVRIINMPDYRNHLLISGGIDLDFRTQAPLVEKIAGMLSDAREARVTSKLGTNITLGLDGREGKALKGMALEPGDFATVPDVEARITPLEGTSNGVIMVDGSICVPGLGLMTEPIKVTVKDGFAVSIEGGPQAIAFANILAGVGDPNAYNIAELGIGLNPMAKLMGVMVEDEGSLGTIHIAVGTSGAFGGKVQTSIHLDMQVLSTTVELDGTPVLKEGEVVVSV
ncbi:MAG: leucyl aminopeptidase [Deltaproteobacteria bacterium]|nr:leucyl aminopeptidase [Deltaproteobacteria bacterium]